MAEPFEETGSSTPANPNPPSDLSGGRENHASRRETPLRGWGRPLSLRVQIFLLIAVSLGVGLLFLGEPVFGDDLDYWSLAFDVHEIGPSAWNVANFHDLRWPVWGPIWVFQAIFGPGLASYYFVPMVMMVGLGLLAFAFGRLAVKSDVAGWACALAVLFSPTLDVVCYRPMPDVGEGVLGGCALLCWWKMMHSHTRRGIIGFGALSGLAIGVAFANRATGIFISPVLALGTLCFFRGRWKLLLVPAGVAAAYFAGECAFYRIVCGDWLNTLHANMGNAHAKDVDPVTFWQLPFRYLRGLVTGSRLKMGYGVLAIIGLGAAWLRYGRAGRMICLWFVVIFFEYNCAIQSVHPLLPLVGMTVRYLSIFALPMSILAGLGALEGVRLVARWKALHSSGVVPFFNRWPAVGIAVAFAVLMLSSKRKHFVSEFSGPMTQYLHALPSGTTVFTHRAMRDLAYLIDPADAARLAWTAPNDILSRNKHNEKAAKACQEFWFLRKMLLLGERRDVNRRGEEVEPPRATFLDSPQNDWRLGAVLQKSGDPELYFYHRRPAEAPPAVSFDFQAKELAGLVPALPLEWTSQESENSAWEWSIPANFRGKLVGLNFSCSASKSEAAEIDVSFLNGSRIVGSTQMRPVFHPKAGRDYFAVDVPAEAERCKISVRIEKGVSRVGFDGLTVYYDEAR